MTDSFVNLSESPRSTATRDAIHVAVIPVVAGEELRPGDSVMVTEGVATKSATPYHRDGVVSPFLCSPVPQDGRVWVLVEPGTVTSMRHEWTHPRFPLHRAARSEVTIVESEEWLRKFARDWNIPYERLIDQAREGEYITFGNDCHSQEEVPEREEMWDHLENVLGIVFPRAHRDETAFSCSCR